MLSTPQKRGKAWPSSFLIGQVHRCTCGCMVVGQQPTSRHAPHCCVCRSCTITGYPRDSMQTLALRRLRPTLRYCNLPAPACTEKSPHHNDAKKNDPAGDTVYSATQLMHTDLQEFMEHTMVARPVVCAGCRRMPERERVLMPFSHPCIPNHSADAALRMARGPCL